jgi:hypothetical protein
VKTEATKDRFNKRRGAFDHEKQDLEAKLKMVMESRRDVEHVLE